VEVTCHLPVVDRSQISGARQRVTAAARDAGFSETDAHRAGIVATELASNLVKHAAHGGEMLLRTRPGESAEVEIVALDRGPGIGNVGQSLSDGYSTAGSAGTGLGAVRRMADEFDIYSQTGNGTVILVRLRPAGSAAPPSSAFEVGGVSVPMPGESVCGDSWISMNDRGRVTVGVVDGLGHGMHAAAAATAAARALASRPYDTPLEGLQSMHAAVRHTRGAAATVTMLDLRKAIVNVAGVGNISTALVGHGTMRQAVSLGGILGHEVRQFREYQYPWASGGMLIMHSDGLQTRWSLDGYPGLRQHHPVTVASVLYRDFRRGKDDVTVVVGREAA
jgi:anti-sigma regulatory factor (Ser/Thr protein kinase)